MLLLLNKELISTTTTTTFKLNTNISWSFEDPPPLRESPATIRRTFASICSTSYSILLPFGPPMQVPIITHHSHSEDEKQNHGCFVKL